MALKNYIVNGLQYQFQEGEQPAGAVEVKKAAPASKPKRPANKARAPRTKES